ncbi:MAG: hypothetical protein AAF357_00725 [Verrucomicrobiota bacterium]
MPGADIDAPIGIQNLDGLGEVGQVGEGFAHAHEYDIPDGVTGFAFDGKDLTDDFPEAVSKAVLSLVIVVVTLKLVVDLRTRAKR